MLPVDQEVILSLHGFLAWFEAYGWIHDKKRRLIQPEANPFQERVARIAEWCLANNVPIRLLLLKPRQKGSSTVSVALLYWLLRREAMNSVIIGGEYSQVANLWKILRLYHARDRFPWPAGGGVVHETNATWANGSALTRETARDAEAGRSGTFQGLIATEAARWREKGVADAASVITGILNCIPYHPGTLAILESTAAGDFGMFYDYWQDAIDLDTYISSGAGPEWNGYFRVFSPWYEHDDSEDQLHPAAAARLESTYTDEERVMAATYGLRPGHISWYRRTMRSECKRDPAVMKREYPGTAEEAFHAASKRRFNNAGLAILEAEARQARGDTGVFEPSDAPAPEGSAAWIFHPCPPEAATVTCWEPPKVGHSYIMAVDIATGASQNDSDDADHHAAVVLRAGYLDPDRGWQRPALVAATPASCRWDIDILASTVHAMSIWYGNCLIVPEANDDRGLIILLKQAGAALYQRHTDDDQPAGARSPKPTGKYGFKTTGGQAENTRSWIIEALARCIREWDTTGDGIYIPDIDTVSELKSFVVKPNGRAEAAEGRHDDRVMALAIGMACIRLATVYQPQARQSSVPIDIYLAERGPGSRREGAQFS